MLAISLLFIYFFQLDSKIKAQIHPSSVMFKTKPELVIFTELICTQKNYLRTLSLVDATWLIEAQPQYFRQHRIIQSGEWYLRIESQVLGNNPSLVQCHQYGLALFEIRYYGYFISFILVIESILKTTNSLNRENYPQYPLRMGPIHIGDPVRPSDVSPYFLRKECKRP